MGKSEETRSTIIEKAAPIFNRNGYTGTSISDITNAVGMTKGAIYGNFTTKEELALESLVFNLKVITDNIAAEVRRHEGSLDRLRAFAMANLDHYDGIEAMGGCPLLNAAIDTDDGNPLLRHKVIDFIREWHKKLVKMIQRGKRRGEIREDADEETFATLFIMIVEGGIMLSKTTGEKKHLEKAVHHIIEVIEKKLAL